MTLIEDIQNAAVDANTDLATLLRKCKVLAAQLKSEPLADWIRWESNGYPEEAKVPDYRVLSLQIRGTFSGFGGQLVKDAHIPILALPEEHRASYEKWECRQSITSLLSIVKEGKTRARIHCDNLALAIKGNLYPRLNCIEAWAIVGSTQILEITNAVHNRVLDFSLAIAKEFPSVGDSPIYSGNTSISSEKTNQIFNTHIYNSGNATIVGNATNSTISFQISQGDLSALRKALQDSGLVEEDIAELQTALDSDSPPTQKGKFGSAVSVWIGKMVGKAANGSWNIGISAAGNVLGKLIENYYGL